MKTSLPLLLFPVLIAATTARKCPAPVLSSGCCCCSGLCLYATCPPCSCPQPQPGSAQPICSLEKLKRRFNVYKEVGTRISSQQGFDVDPGKTTDVGHPGQLVTAPPLCTESLTHKVPGVTASLAPPPHSLTRGRALGVVRRHIVDLRVLPGVAVAAGQLHRGRGIRHAC